MVDHDVALGKGILLPPLPQTPSPSHTYPPRLPLPPEHTPPGSSPNYPTPPSSPKGSSQSADDKKEEESPISGDTDPINSQNIEHDPDPTQTSESEQTVETLNPNTQLIIRTDPTLNQELDDNDNMFEVEDLQILDMSFNNSNIPIQGEDDKDMEDPNADLVSIKG